MSNYVFCDAAGIGRCVKELITTNPVAAELATIWDNTKSENILGRCDQLESRWTKMVWLNRICSLADNMSVLGFIFGITGFVLSLLVNWWFACLEVVVTIVFVWATYRLGVLIRRKLREYCQIADPLWYVNDKFRNFIDRIERYGAKDIDEARKLIDRMCLTIVSLEMVGVKMEQGLTDPFPWPGRSPHWIEFGTVREHLVDLVNSAASVYVTTADLGIHFQKAKDSWYELAARGEVQTEYQI